MLAERRRPAAGAETCVAPGVVARGRLPRRGQPLVVEPRRRRHPHRAAPEPARHAPIDAALERREQRVALVVAPTTTWSALAGSAPDPATPSPRRNHEENDEPAPLHGVASAVLACCAWPAAAPTRGDGDGGRRHAEERRVHPARRPDGQESLGDNEGALNILAWPGYAEDGTHRPVGRLGDAVRGGDRLPGQRQVLRHLRRGRHADEDRRVRRGLGLRRRDAAADRGRRRGAGQHRPDPELRRHLRLPQGPGLELRRRPDVRRPARLRRQPADVQHRRGRARRRPAGARSSTTRRRTPAR